MNLKLRFDPKDMKKFLIACLVILYIVAIAISNLSSITSTGEFTGLNPLPAFSSDLIGATFVFFIVAIVALLISCKSYFFEFEKGIGFTTDKKSDGYAKWCDPKDMKKQLNLVLPSDAHADHAGVALINDGKKIYVDDSEFHNLVIGSTGSGKTTAIIYPMIELLSKHGESMILTDPKGELYEKKSNMLRAKGYNIILLNFRDPGRGNTWNPLTLPYKLWKNGNQDKATELLEDLATNILYDEGNKNSDPFWEKTSADYFSGLTLGLFEDAKEEEINLNSISLMTTVGEEKIGNSTYVKEYFQDKDPNGSAYISASSTILAPNDTKMSIISVFKQKIKLFATRINLSEMLSYSDFSIEDIGMHKTALFIVIQDEKKTYHSLVTILIKQIYETLIDVAQNHGGKLPVRTNFLLDEFANMPPLKDVTTMITAARSRQMRFTMIIQNFAQLNEVYGEQNAETIKGNAGNLIYLISTELRALEEISKMCGEVKVKSDKEGKPDETRPLITISDLQKLKMNEVIVRRLRMAPFKTKLTPDYKMNWGREFPKADIMKIAPRERREVKVFDIREFVKEKKKQKNPFANMGGSTGGFGGGFGGGFPPNPFGGMGDDSFKPPFPPLFGNQDKAGNSGSSIDVDKILANLDAKIAEIEAEEKKISEEEAKEQDKLQTDINKVDKKEIQDANVLDTKPNNIENLEEDNSFKNFLNTFNDDDFKTIPLSPIKEETNKPSNIDELMNKINEQNVEANTNTNTNTNTNINIKPNVESKDDNKYQEVSDDEFFDDFFDE